MIKLRNHDSRATVAATTSTATKGRQFDINSSDRMAFALTLQRLLFDCPSLSNCQTKNRVFFNIRERSMINDNARLRNEAREESAIENQEQKIPKSVKNQQESRSRIKKRQTANGNPGVRCSVGVRCISFFGLPVKSYSGLRPLVYQKIHTQRT